MILEMMLLSYFDNCIYHFNIKVFNLFNSDSQSISTEPMIKKQIKRVLSELKNFKVQRILILKYKKKNGQKSSIRILN